MSDHLPILIVTVGLPRSGKTTWARAQKVPIVSPDAIRLALYGEVYKQEGEDMVWTLAKYMVKSLFLAGHEIVILDATNTTKKRRMNWISKEWLTALQVFNTPVSECIARARSDEKEYLVPVIERMAKQFESLDMEEQKLMPSLNIPQELSNDIRLQLLQWTSWAMNNRPKPE